MPDQLLLDVCSVLIRYVVQQVADTPCHMYLFCVLEVGTVNSGGRNTHWVYDADVGRFYRPISEQDTQAGYVDIFLCPMLDIYSDMKHSYIVELKYAKYRDSENRVEELRQEAIAQANRYADTDTVKQAIGSTQLHKIVVVYKGMEMRICEEL